MRKKLLRAMVALAVAVMPMAKSEAQIMRPEFVDHWGWSLGAAVGATDLWGDVGTKNVMDHYNNGNYKTQAMGGVFARYTFHPAISIKMALNYGRVYASDDYNEDLYKGLSGIDAYKSDAYQRYLRNLNVRTDIYEGLFMFEITPLRIGGLNSRISRMRFQPYLQFGIGGFYFNPKGEHAFLDGRESRWINLYDLSLEGNGLGYPGAPERYKRWQMNVPLAFGFRWDIAEQYSLGIEYMYRYCFTDYLDNVSGSYIDPALFDVYLPAKDAAIARDMSDRSYLVSPDYKHKGGDLRGNSAVNDAYSSVSISFFYKLKSRHTPWWWYFREY